jgi:deoxyadenosine/deoxycytidine kinase
MQNTVIYLIGFPGTGKYTTAKAIAELENFIVVDNQYINNPVLNLIPLDGKTKIPERAWENCSKIREIIFDTMICLSPASYNFVLTNVLFESNEDYGKIYRQVEKMAQGRNSLFVPVRLLCSQEEIKRRIVSEDRQLRLKENDPNLVSYYFEREVILKPDHPNLLELDNSNLQPHETAKKIIEFAKSLTFRNSSTN